MNKKALRNEDQCSRLWGDLQSYAEIRKLPGISKEEVRTKVNRTFDKLQSIALEVMSISGAEKTIWIVLDRVDRCSVMPGEKSQARHRAGRSLLRTMVEIAEKASPTVKILAVVNRADWHIDEEVDEIKSRQESLEVLTCFQSGELSHRDR